MSTYIYKYIYIHKDICIYITYIYIYIYIYISSTNIPGVLRWCPPVLSAIDGFLMSTCIFHDFENCSTKMDGRKALVAIC